MTGQNGCISAARPAGPPVRAAYVARRSCRARSRPRRRGGAPEGDARSRPPPPPHPSIHLSIPPARARGARAPVAAAARRRGPPAWLRSRGRAPVRPRARACGCILMVLVATLALSRATLARAQGTPLRERPSRAGAREHAASGEDEIGRRRRRARDGAMGTRAWRARWGSAGTCGGRGMRGLARRVLGPGCARGPGCLCQRCSDGGGRWAAALRQQWALRESRLRRDDGFGWNSRRRWPRTHHDTCAHRRGRAERPSREVVQRKRLVALGGGRAPRVPTTPSRARRSRRR